MRVETNADNCDVEGVVDKLTDELDEDVITNDERGYNSIEVEKEQLHNDENGIAISSTSSDDMEMGEALNNMETSTEYDDWMENKEQAVTTMLMKQTGSMANVVEMNTAIGNDDSNVENNERVNYTRMKNEEKMDSTVENKLRVNDSTDDDDDILSVMEYESTENEEEMDTYGFDELAVKDSRYTKDTMIKVATGKGLTVANLTFKSDIADEEFEGFPACELRTTNLKCSLMKDAVAEALSYRNKKQPTLSISDSSSISWRRSSSDNSDYDERIEDNNPYAKRYRGKKLSNKKKKLSSRMSNVDDEPSFFTTGRICVPKANNRASGKPLVTSVTDALEAWNFFITDSILRRIVKGTNAAISRRKFRNYALTAETNVAELKAFFGILYMASWLQKCGFTIQSAFSGRGLGMDFILACMPYKRFRFLLNTLMVASPKASSDDSDDDEEYEEEEEEKEKEKKKNKKRRDRFPTKDKDEDPLKSVRWLLNKFLNGCRSKYRPGEKLMVRELSRSFRGKCDFVKQHRKGEKKAKNCLKLLIAVDPTEGYIYNAVVTETEVDESAECLEAVARNVLRLMEPIKHTERIVFTDERISSISICVDLLNRYGLKTTGMIEKQLVLRAVKRDSIDASTLTAYNSKFFFSPKIGTTFVSYNVRKNRTVFAVSTVHSGKRVEPHSGILKRPVIIADYDRTLKRVRELEKRFASVRLMKAPNWRSGLLFALLEIAAVNSYLLLFHHRTNEVPFAEFFQNLILSLAKDFTSKRSVFKKIEIPEDDSGPCEMCSRYSRKSDKSGYRCAKCYKLICSEHSIVLCKHCNNHRRVLSDDDDDSIIRNDEKNDPDSDDW